MQLFDTIDCHTTHLYDLHRGISVVHNMSINLRFFIYTTSLRAVRFGH